MKREKKVGTLQVNYEFGKDVCKVDPSPGPNFSFSSSHKLTIDEGNRPTYLSFIRLFTYSLCRDNVILE